MKKFAYIQDDDVKQIGELPVNWKNISNFHALEDDLLTLKQHGWLPVETLSENKETQIGITYLIEEYCVKEIIETRDKTQQEIEKENNSITESKWRSIRNQRNNFLRESDSDVVSDKWEQMSPEVKKSLSAYRQELRDLPQKFLTPDDVVWPNTP